MSCCFLARNSVQKAVSLRHPASELRKQHLQTFFFHLEPDRHPWRLFPKSIPLRPTSVIIWTSINNQLKTILTLSHLTSYPLFLNFSDSSHLLAFHLYPLIQLRFSFLLCPFTFRVFSQRTSVHKLSPTRLLQTRSTDFLFSTFPPLTINHSSVETLARSL